MKKSGKKKSERKKGEQLLFEGALPEVDGARRAEALRRIRQAARERTLRPRLPLWELILTQIKYISPGYWLGQGAFLVFLGFCFYGMRVDETLGGYMARFSGAFAIAGVFGAAELGRHLSCGAAEVEQSCYFRLTQLWMMKMILFGAVDILAISVLTGGIASRTETGFGPVCVYLLVPFVLSNACYLLLLTGARGGGGRYQQFGAAAMLGIAAMLPSVNPRVYYVNYLWVWALLLAGGTALLAVQVRSAYQKMSKGETLCWN